MGASNDRADDSLFIEQITVAKDGNDQQRAELLESFRNYLRVIAINKIGPDTRGKLSVSDLVQETIIGAFDGLKGCRASNEAEFKAWLRQILTNELSNRYLYLHRLKRDVHNEVPIGSNFEIAPLTDAPIDQVLRSEQRRELADAIESLSADHQQVIRLKHQEGLSFTEIGEKMIRSSDAVRMLWNRAMDELGKKLPKSDRSN